MKLGIIATLLCLGLTAAADPTITAVTARQRYPWNGLVDITVTLSGTSNEVAKTECTFVATNNATKASIPVDHLTCTGTVPANEETTWTRSFIWDAIADVGEVKIDEVALTAIAEWKLGGVQLWKDGPYWAECNVGATKPEEYGYYFWWGDTVGYKREGGVWTDELYYSGVTWVSSDGIRLNSFPYGSSTPTFGIGDSELQSMGYIDATDNLVAAHDAATAHLGVPWRMPTETELSELVEKCDTTWTKCGGTSGMRVTGRGVYSSNSIFLPAAGIAGSLLFADNDGDHLNSLGTIGFYWSTTWHFDSAYWVMSLRLDECGGEASWWASCYNGCSIRPLRGFVKGQECGVAVTNLSLDCRTGMRTIDGTTERITFSPVWGTDVDSAVVTVLINGVVVTNASGAGIFTWTPMRSGVYTFTHKVTVAGGTTGETMRASFAANGFTPDEHYTCLSDVAVPYSWIRNHLPRMADKSDGYEVAVSGLAANGHNTVVEAYVAGLDPSNSSSELSATVVSSNGMVYVGWAPNLNTNSVTRIYTLSGRTNLTTGDWETPIQPWHRFFKVAVAMPTGAADETTSVADEGFVPEDDSAALGGVQLWKDGPYWAECNVGATKPEEYGYYFWWGDTVGYKRDGGYWTGGLFNEVTWISSAGDHINTNPFESFKSPTYGKDIIGLRSLGYIDSTGNLAAAYDAAVVHLGAPWRMPTSSEINDLISKCSAAWISTNGTKGLLVTGTGNYMSKSIFLPATGYACEYSSTSRIYDPTYRCCYWSSSPNDTYSGCAWMLEFTEIDDISLGNGNRDMGLPVRPVRAGR